MAAKKKAKAKAPKPPREKKKPGPPPHEPTQQQRGQVEMLAAYGIKQDDIAKLIGVSDVTLRQHYRAELDLGAAKVTAQVANALVKKALSERPDAVNAAKFYLQAKAGWSEKQNVEHSGAVTVSGPNLSDLSDAELDQLEKLAGRLAGQPSSPH